MQGQILPKIWPIKCHHFYIAKTNVNFATVRKYGSLSQCPPIIGDSGTSDIVALYHSLQCPLDIKNATGSFIFIPYSLIPHAILSIN